MITDIFAKNPADDALRLGRINLLLPGLFAHYGRQLAGTEIRQGITLPLVQSPFRNSTCGGHLTRFSALPVLTYYKYAALRSSKTSYASPQRLSKRALSPYSGIEPACLSVLAVVSKGVGECCSCAHPGFIHGASGVLQWKRQSGSVCARRRKGRSTPPADG